MKTTESSTDSLVLDLADPAATLERAGGKGMSLARMAAGNLPVPPGFHVTTSAYDRFVAAAGLSDHILRTAATVVPDEPASWEKAAERIAALFAEQPIPPEIERAIVAAYDALGTDIAVAVRSSATAEDLPEMSFAGQQETYLNIRGAQAVVDAVRRCWASLWTGRAIGYRARHGIDSAEVSLAVVVQELVPADAAGVMFSADPLTGARDQVMINAAWGLGEAIVSGQVTPDTLVVAKADGAIRRRDISVKEVMTVRTSTGTEEVPVPAKKRERPVLTARQVAELARIAVRIEEFYGRPMDIEWAMHADKLFVVQARPITALPDEPGAQQPPTDWPLPNPKGRYMRASVMELLPEPLSPLFATLALPAWARATIDRYHSIGLPYFDDPLAVINGYGYYYVAYPPGMLARMMLAQPRFLAVSLPRALRAAPQRWRAGHARYTELAEQSRRMPVHTATAGALLEAARALVEEAARYYLTLQGGVLPAAYISEGLFTSVYQRMRRKGDPEAATFLLGFDSKPIRAEKSLYDLARWIRTQPGLAERIAALSRAEAADLLANVPERDGDALHEFVIRFAGHLAIFGNTVYNLDFAEPLPADEPAPLLQTLAFFGTEDAPDPRARQRTAQVAREQAVESLRSRRPGLRRALALRLLRWAQTMAPLREDGLADVGLGWPEVRMLLREIGRRLADAGIVADIDDVFALRIGELEEAVQALDAGGAHGDYRAAVAARRAARQAQRQVSPPHVLPVKGGLKLFGINLSKFLPARDNQESTDVITGVPGSPGRITAPARIIRGPEEFDRMRPGDVLVAKITTPAWTSLFSLASAVVTDVGGPLSHSSIVAREYHIPAVLGTGVATARLRDGAQVTVDGNAGTVVPVES